MTTKSPTNKSSTPLSPSQKVAKNKLLHALAKLSPQKRAELVKNEAKRRGLIEPAAKERAQESKR